MPDGSEIAFVRQEKPNFGNWDLTRIQVVETASGEIRALSGAATGASVPTFSPDGSMLAFASDRSGSQQIYVTDADGTPHQLTTAGSNHSPTWVGETR